MEYQLSTVNLGGLHFKKGANAKTVPLPFDIPEGAEFLAWEDMKLSYFVPSDTEDDVMEQRDHTFTEKEVADAKASLVIETPLSDLKANKLKQLARAAKEESHSDLTTSDGLVFHTDASTMIHVQGLKGWFASTGETIYPNYKNADGSVNNLSEENVDTAIEEYTARLYDIYSVRFASKKAQVEAAATKDELENINW